MEEVKTDDRSEKTQETNITRVVYEEALKAYRQKDFPKAAQLFYELFKRDTHSSVVCYFGGISAFRVKEWDIAEKMFLKTTELKKNYYHDMYARVFLGLIAIRRSDFEQAKKQLEKTIESDFLNPLPYSFLGYIANKEKKYEEADKMFQKSMKFDRNNPSFNNNLGFNYLDWNRQIEKAQYHISYALRKDANNHYYLHSMGWYFFIKKNFQNAIEFFKRSLQIVHNKQTEEDLKKSIREQKNSERV